MFIKSLLILLCLSFSYNYVLANSSTLYYSDSVFLNLKIVGNGSVYFKNITSKKLDTVNISKSISFVKNDSLSITVINNSLYIFNGYKGIISHNAILRNY